LAPHRSPGASSRAALLERELQVVADAVEHPFRGHRVGAERLLGDTEMEGECDEVLLGAVVEITSCRETALPSGDAVAVELTRFQRECVSRPRMLRAVEALILL
jgi:hypothetical protein